jgi:hyperosmotically inducible protein
MYRSLKSLSLLGILSAGTFVPLTAFATNMKENALVYRHTASGFQREAESRLARQVRHELLMLPYYGVFDNLEFRVDGSTVMLSGQVVRPTLKSEAENVVKSIEGVQAIDNQIEVLPTSLTDDQIRLRVYRAIYRQASLNQYALRAVPTIHIIVQNGHVTLEGAVAREMDKNIANMQAGSVSGVFSVTNNLRIDS